MSRIGRKPIPIPSDVEVKIEKDRVLVKGPKGELFYDFNPNLSVSQEDGFVVVSRPGDGRVYRSLHGLTRTLIANMVTGVTQGFTKSLGIVGVGYRAQWEGNSLVLQVGFSHRVEISPPPGISITVEGNNRINVEGIDKQQVGQIAAEIRAVRPPDRYKGKGIRYLGEEVRLKPGKRAVTTAL
ncbi:MAG: 50S ribosomal protein L6 [Dehalococcoidia bacterium]